MHRRRVKITHDEVDKFRSERDMILAEYAENQRWRKQVVEKVLEMLRNPVFDEIERDGCSPLLKLACLIVHEQSEHLPARTEIVPGTGEIRAVGIDAPLWILQKSMEIQWQSIPRKKIRDQETSALDIKNCIKTLLQYDFVQYLKSKNRRRLNVDQFLSNLTPGITPDGIKKRREKAARLQLSWMTEKFQFDGEAYFVFGVDTDYIEKIFKQVTGLREVIK